MNPERLTQSRPGAAAMHDTGTPAWLSPATDTPEPCAAIGENACATNALPSTREISRAARAPAPSGSPVLHASAWPAGSVQV